MKITAEQRRARLAHRHCLAAPAPSVEHAADSVLALHATDPASVFLSAQARTAETGTDDVESALFTDRTMLRTLAMRRTLFVATTTHLPAIERSSSPDVAAKERKVLEKALAAAEIKSPKRWLSSAFKETLAAMDQSGVTDPAGFPARSLTKLVPRLTTRIVLGGGKHSVESGATSRVLGLMAVEGLIARGRPAGSWTGRQYAWHRRDQWLVDEPDAPDSEQAAQDLLRLWLERFGPGTLHDMKWWTGWTVAKTKKTLASLDTVEVELDDAQVGYVLASDTAPVDNAASWVALLPALDPTPMGWHERDWYLGDYRKPLFDRNGNIGPTIWADGRIVGGWGQRANGDIGTELFEKVSAKHEKLLASHVDRLAGFLGDVVVKPSFPTPLAKELAAS